MNLIVKMMEDKKVFTFSIIKDINVRLFCVAIFLIIIFSCNNSKYADKEEVYYPSGQLKRLFCYDSNSEIELIVDFSQDGDTTAIRKYIKPYIGNVEFFEDSLIYKFYLQSDDIVLQEWLVVKNDEVSWDYSNYVYLKEKGDLIGLGFVGPKSFNFSLVFYPLGRVDSGKVDTLTIDRIEYFNKDYLTNKMVKGIIKDQYKMETGEKYVRERDVQINWELKRAFQEFYGID